MPKYLCKLWSADRSKKKAFMCQASLALILTKAKDYSLRGNKIVLESDGTEIEDDEALQAFLEEKSTLIILHSGEFWTPPGMMTTSTNFTGTPSMINTSTNASGTPSMITTSTNFTGTPSMIATSTNLTGIPSIITTSTNLTGTITQKKLQVSQPALSTDVSSCIDSDDFGAVISSSQEEFPKTPPQAICDLFIDFKIPWNKMSTEIKKSLKEKKHLGKLLNHFCNTIVDELRQKSVHIPMTVYRNISQIAVDQYPESFVERDSQKNIISRIPISLITTMRNRNNFLNTVKKRRSSSATVPPKFQKNTISYSCVNWQPNSSEDEDYTTKKQFLISMHGKKSLEKSEEETVLQYMADCFASQRKFFNNKPTVEEILQHWPMIFNKKCLFQHFEKLMELQVPAFKSHFRESEEKMKSFFRIADEGGDEEIFKAISRHFKENHELLFSKFEFGTGAEDIKINNHILTPWISIHNVSPSHEVDPISYIWLEGEITAVDNKCDIVDLILCLLCYYYVFNIEYPKDISQTCEFLMRFLFKFYPSQLRGQKKHINSLRKINTLITKIENIFENIVTSGQFWNPPGKITTSTNLTGTPSMITTSTNFTGTITKKKLQVSQPTLSTDVSSCNDSDDIGAAISSPQEKFPKTPPQAICDLFIDFKIPWNKMSTEIKKSLKEKKHLGKLLNNFCNTIVDELRQKSLYIPMSVYRNISQMAVDKYPESFVERDSQKNIISHIPILLITTMRNRNNFLNYGEKRRSSRATVPHHLQKNINTISHSCVNWQPNSSEDEDYTTKKQFLISMHEKKFLQQSEEETVLQYMADCFASQRKFFNSVHNKPTVKEILQHWPMIFNKKCLFQHFEKLMELQVPAFKSHFRESEEKMKAFFQITDEGDDEEIFKAISKHFKENHELLFSKFELGTGAEDIKINNNILTPWISIHDVTPSNEVEPISYIWLEGEITAVDNKCDIVDLILCLLCYYYVFNIEYPKDISQTCEFLMRFFFKFYPSQVRGQKKHINCLSKINTLISKIENIFET